MSDPQNLITGGLVGAVITALTSYLSSRLASNNNKVVQVTTATNEATDKLFKSLQTTIDDQQEIIKDGREERRVLEQQLADARQRELLLRTRAITTQVRLTQLESIETAFGKVRIGLDMVRRARRAGGSRWYDDGPAANAVDKVLDDINDAIGQTGVTVPLVTDTSDTSKSDDTRTSGMIDPALGGA